MAYWWRSRCRRCRGLLIKFPNPYVDAQYFSLFNIFPSSTTLHVAGRRSARLRSERPEFKPWPGLFLGNTLYSHGASIHSGVQMGRDEFTVWGNPAIDEHPIQGGVEILLVVSCYRNRDMLRPGEPLGSYTDLTLRHILHVNFPYSLSIHISLYGISISLMPMKIRIGRLYGKLRG